MTSCAALGLRERSRALDKVGLFDRGSRPDQLAAPVDVIPHVPEEEPARPPVIVDVRDNPLAVRLLPALDSREPRVDLAHRLVTQIEHVGVEEREMVVRNARTGHVRADRAAVRLRMVLVLEAEATAERGERETRDVPGREDVFAALDAA